jgi:hypothetical protein
MRAPRGRIFDFCLLTSDLWLLASDPAADAGGIQENEQDWEKEPAIVCYSVLCAFVL